MSEYPAAAPLQNTSQNTAFQAAVQRAKLIAAKIDGSGSKRPLEEGTEPSAKKIASLEAAADYQQQAGGNMGGAVTGGPRGPGTPGGVPQQMMPEQTINEYIRVPDKMVGLIIGRGGEQISRLQAESGCKIQMAPDSGGQPDRVCTLTGSREAVSRAKEMVNAIVNQRGRDGGPPDGNQQQQRVGPGGQSAIKKEEIMIPGPKVGLIIGKGGETIKQLQEKSGAKMVVIQDGPNPEFEKPLRITGEHAKIEYAKQLVYELIAEKDMQYGGPRGGPGKQPNNNPHWSGGNEEFDQQGAPDERQDGNRPSGPRGPPRNGEAGGPGGPGLYGTWGGPQDNKIEVSFTVSNIKCGIIIGRGGEVIKQINAQSGAHCELDRRTQNNRGNRTFYIRGEPDNVEAAKRIIIEKAGMPINFVDSNSAQNNSGPNSGPGGAAGPGGPNNNPADYGGNYGGGQPAPTAGGGVGGAAGGGVAMWGYNPHWHQQQQPQDPQPQQSVPINPVTGQPDYSQQWIDYYKSMGMTQEAEKIEQQQKATKAAAAAAVGGQQPNTQHLQGTIVSTNGAGATTVANVTTAGNSNSQPDYSAQWAEYYRSIGKIKEAEAIESNMKQKAAVSVATAGPTNTAVGAYGSGAQYQPQPYQQHYPSYGPYPGYPQQHPAPPDQQQ